jgi:hypothetical protein
MKSIWCTIGVLGALLVFATLDAQPDPPAVNPRAALTNKAVQPLDHACGTAPLQGDSIVKTSNLLSRSWFAASACDPRVPSDQIDVTVQAADSSPPCC